MADENDSEIAPDGFPVAAWGGKRSVNECDYYVVAVPEQVRESKIITLAICSRCGVPVYDQEMHDDFHERQEAVRGAVSDMSSGQ